MNTKLAPKLAFSLFICFFAQISPCLAIEPINYDTAWTQILDGGMWKDLTTPMTDIVYDVAEYKPGQFVAVGRTGDTSEVSGSLILKFDSTGVTTQKKFLFTNHMNGAYNHQELHSVTIAKNGDFLVGGNRSIGPLVMRLSQELELKWTIWYYDSIYDNKRISCMASVNSIRETSRGTIVCAAGYHFTENIYRFGDNSYNCAGYLELDSLGVRLHGGELYYEGGYYIGGSSVEESPDGSYFLIAGNQTINFVDTTSYTQGQTDYYFQLDGVGLVMNNITALKKLRDGTYMVAGQSYEENCWTEHKRLAYDAWWTPINSSGLATTRNTAGTAGGSDVLYNFTQLNDGNLVFIGIKGGTGALWTFVTDSTGSNFLWEKHWGIPCKGRGFTPVGISVCANSQNGFTVVGKISTPDTLGGVNGFIAHFVPKAENAVKKTPKLVSMNKVSCKVIKSRVMFTFGRAVSGSKEISIFDVSGKLVMRKTADINSTTVSFDASRVVKGVYFYTAKSGPVKTKGKFIINK